mmetsp:Transcript_112537/g.157825  ORF Transcript_112537/g.157825 Transcript_112537/m.157825 type:complete len:81 (+) Transcript_112537:130-372(+)
MQADLSNPTYESEKQKNKLKRLVQAPNSYFMDVKCNNCKEISQIFSHAQSVIMCEGCNTVLCRPTGGKVKLSVGTAYKVK